MKRLLILLVPSLFFLFSCNKVLFDPLPKIETLQAIIGDATHVTLQGNVISEGGTAVTTRGFCWAFTANPTVNDFFSQNEFGPGQFTEDIVVMYDRTYYVKAYATNSNGTSYGNEVTFKTEATLPVLTTDSITGVTSSSAVIYSSLINDGGLPIFVSGACWNRIGSPTINDKTEIFLNDIDPLSCTINHLNPNTEYFIRTFATNSLGTGYSMQIKMKTLESSEGHMIEGSVTLATGITGDLSDVVVGLYQSIDDWDEYRPLLVTDVTGSGSTVNFLFENINVGSYYLDAWADNDFSGDWSNGDFVGWYGTGTKDHPNPQAFIVSNENFTTINITCIKY